MGAFCAISSSEDQVLQPRSLLLLQFVEQTFGDAEEKLRAAFDSLLNDAFSAMLASAFTGEPGKTKAADAIGEPSIKALLISREKARRRLDVFMDCVKAASRRDPAETATVVRRILFGESPDARQSEQAGRFAALLWSHARVPSDVALFEKAKLAWQQIWPEDAPDVDSG